jgi:transcriptional regulator with XRE-family HTH domain
VQGWELRAARRAAGLSAAALARAAGTSETNVAAYERGVRSPNRSTTERLLAGIAAGADSPVFVHRLLTVPATAAAIRRGLRAGWSVGDLLRVVRESRSNAKWAQDDLDRSVLFAAPSTTGDLRWDALLAGSTEDLAARISKPAPAWTRGHVLRPFWFVGSDPAVDAYAVARSPAALKVRGVMIDPAELESV